MSDIKNVFGTNLKLKRIEKKLTQEQLSELADVEVRTISRIECGDFGTEFGTIEKFCAALDAEPFEFFLPIDVSEPSPNEAEDEEESEERQRELLIRAQEVYSSKIDELARRSGIDPSPKRKVKKDKLAVTRFNKNRNRQASKLAPIRVAALAESFDILLDQCPDEDPAVIWTTLQKIHYQIATGIRLPNYMVEAVVSAHQSWNKSSGTAFERFIAARMSEIMPQVSVIKPGEFEILKLTREVINAEKVLGNMEDDLFVVYESDGETWLIGVLQQKASVRDRVKMDISHSKLMVEAGLWSALITVDPDNFLDVPKFRGFADGISEHGRIWHGVYKMSATLEESEGVFDISKLEAHLPQVVEAVINERMNADWQAMDEV